MRSKTLLALVFFMVPVAAFATHVPGSSEVIVYDGSLTPGTPASGTIGWASPVDGYDWYCVDVTSGTLLSLTAARTSGDIVPNIGIMRGLAETGGKATLPLVEDSNNSTATSVTLTATPDFTGPATIWVSTFLGEDQGNYTLTMTGGARRSSCGTATTPSGPLLGVQPPDDVIIGNSSTVIVPFRILRESSFSADVAMNVTGLPDDVTWSLSPNVIKAPGHGPAKLTITTGPITQPGAYVTQITATGGEATAASTFIVEVVCDPPFFLGISQPKSQSVARGGTATVEAKPVGSGPFFYQWYNGYPGMTWSPVSGATKASFTTPAVNDTNTFWVRVSNACGSADSGPVTVSPQ